ncbi:MAG: ABC transporter permease subunit [Firmicutes bacterium]|nr:ABC transporter permease subunit [Bacillota bacterium]
MGEYFRLLKGEFLKQKKSFIWPVVVLTPLLGAFLSFCNLFFRYDYLMSLEHNQGHNSWQLLLNQHHFIWAFLLSLVATIIASHVHYLEYRSNSWKQALALPVSRANTYLAKWSVVLILNTLMISGNSIYLVAVGKGMGFTELLDVNLFLNYTAYQILAITSLIGIQSWLSTSLNNANVALAIGFVGVASSLFFAQSEQLAKFLPYAHMIYTLPDPTINNAIALYYGLTFGLIFLGFGIMFFKRKEIY